MKRKLLALTLTLAMALSVLTTAGFAEGEPDYQEMVLDTPVAVTWNGDKGSYFLFVAPETGYYTLTTYNKEEYNGGWLITAKSLDGYPNGDSASWTTGFTHFMLKGGRYVYSSGADREHGYTMSLSKTMGFDAFVSNAETWDVGNEEGKTVTMPATTVKGYATFKAIAVRFPASGRYRVDSGTTGGVGRVTCGILLDETGSVVSVGQNGFPSLMGADVEAGKTYYLLPDSLTENETPFGLGAEQVDPVYYCTTGRTHDFEEEAVKKATMTEDGWVKSRCEVCGREETLPLPAIDSFALYQTSFNYDGEERRPGAYAMDKNGDSLHWRYGYPQNVEYSDNVNAGTATAKITIDNGYYEGEATLPFQINPLTLDDSCIHPIDPQSYTGSPVKPEVTVSYSKYSDPLVEGTDYTLSCQNNIDAGTAAVTVTGVGNYTGTAQAAFQIKPAAVSKATAAAIKDQTYTGKALKPAVKLTFGGRTLKAGTDYTAAYKNNKAAGKATVTVTGAGNFSGTKKLTFTIKKAANPVTVKGKTAAVKYSAVKKKAQTIPAKNALTVSKAQGKVTCKKSSGNKNITVSPAGKLTVKKGLKKGSYPIKVKVTAAGNGNYKSAAKTVTVKVVVK